MRRRSRSHDLPSLLQLCLYIFERCSLHGNCVGLVQCLVPCLVEFRRDDPSIPTSARYDLPRVRKSDELTVAWVVCGSVPDTNACDAVNLA